ncbi:MAG: glycoside hydrolase [Rikenellaceae bacterium]
MRKFILMGMTTIMFMPNLIAQNAVKLVVDYSDTKQTIHSFGASDCWRTQYIGNWDLDKREEIADLLFSSETDKNGNPKGIALSIWRFNIGSGSHEAEDGAGIGSSWRKTDCFLNSDGSWNWDRQAGQRWFLEAARERGVRYSLAFSISAPYFYSKNGMTRASEKGPHANLKSDCYDDYAAFMAEVSTKLNFDYLSPINEPQWEWITSRQEGMQATNEECSRLIHEIDKELKKRSSKTKIVYGEAGDIRYLYNKNTDKPKTDNQIKDIFTNTGENSIVGLESVANIISGHSYWSTWPIDTLISTRQQLDINMPDGFDYWQTEYCPMEKNEDNPNGGGGRDTTINTALYIARVIHHDLVVANATSWQSWTAFSEWNYKDGLIFIDDGVQKNGANEWSDPLIEKCKSNGEFRVAKTLWGLGNYSRFVRPEMVRVESYIEGKSIEESAKSLMVSSFIEPKSEKCVIVLVNFSEKEHAVDVNVKSSAKKIQSFKMYETSEHHNLEYMGKVKKSICIPSRSIITLESL